VAYEISETSFRQGRVAARQLGRVNATVHVATVLAQLLATMLGGVIGATIGLRASLFLAPLIAIAGVVVLWASPLRTERTPDPEPVAG
jgi:predicted MFS family arabinose efflux permease